MAIRNPYNPVTLNAKTGFVYVNECVLCWALVSNERTENHANWHERQQKSGGSDDNQDNLDKLAEARAEVERIEVERQERENRIIEAKGSDQRARRDPRRAKS